MCRLVSSNQGELRNTSLGTQGLSPGGTVIPVQPSEAWTCYFCLIHCQNEWHHPIRRQAQEQGCVLRVAFSCPRPVHCTQVSHTAESWSQNVLGKEGRNIEAQRQKANALWSHRLKIPVPTLIVKPLRAPSLPNPHPAYLEQSRYLQGFYFECCFYSGRRCPHWFHAHSWKGILTTFQAGGFAVKPASWGLPAFARTISLAPWPVSPSALGLLAGLVYQGLQSGIFKYQEWQFWCSVLAVLEQGLAIAASSWGCSLCHPSKAPSLPPSSKTISL